jgi:hypothetical protein
MLIVLRVFVFLLGMGVVVATLYSAVASFVLPRSAPTEITRVVFVVLRWIFESAMHRARTYQARDRIMAFYAPVGLLLLVPTWLALVLLGYAGMFWGAGSPDWYTAFQVSGSSLLTLGFASHEGFGLSILEFTEATVGLILIALLIAYLPTMYAAFSRREVAVSLLEVRAGTPPSAIEMLERFKRIGYLGRLSEQWETWETWFAEIEESHTSLSALVFFRSPRPELSWVTAAGAVLDTASLTLAAVDIPPDPQAALCIRAGFLALRRISDFFSIDYNPDPHYPADPISVTRQEFEAALDRLDKYGLPIKSDREKAWVDFAGWRVNYDRTLIALARLTMAPESPWTGDRNGKLTLPPVFFRHDKGS